jgi:hypothetical protein
MEILLQKQYSEVLVSLSQQQEESLILLSSLHRLELWSQSSLQKSKHPKIVWSQYTMS